MVPLKPVQSTMIHAAGYDPASQILAVHFLRGADPGPYIHHFKDVPPALGAEFEAAESKGQFFNARIRGQFEQTSVLAEAYGAEQEPAAAE